MTKKKKTVRKAKVRPKKKAKAKKPKPQEPVWEIRGELGKLSDDQVDAVVRLLLSIHEGYRKTKPRSATARRRG